MKKHIATGIALAGIALASGCAITTTANVTPLASTWHTPTRPREILVYVEEKDVPAPFERLALIEVTGDWKLTSQATFIQKAEEEAAGFGANAILIKETQDPSKSAKAVDVLVSVVAPQGAEIRRKQQVIALWVPALASPQPPNPPPGPTAPSGGG